MELGAFQSRIEKRAGDRSCAPMKLQAGSSGCCHLRLRTAILVSNAFPAPFLRF